MITTRAGLAAGAFAIAMGVAGVANAYTYTVNATAKDYFNRNTPEVTINLACSSYYQVTEEDPQYGGIVTNTYSYSSNYGSCTTSAQGGCSFTVTLTDEQIAWQQPNAYGTYDSFELTGCELDVPTLERALDWQQLNVVSQTNIDLGSWSNMYQNRTSTVAVTNLMPAPSVKIDRQGPYVSSPCPGLNCKSHTYWNGNTWTSRTVGASMYLFVSPDGVYDKPVVVVDGWDPTNDRDAYDLYASAAFMAEWQSNGADIWFFNPAEGSDGLRTHMDDLAYALKYAAEYGGLQRIDTVVGISAGGIVGRNTLALIEHVKNGGAVPSWFSYGQDATRKNFGNKAASFVSWDSPYRGSAGVPSSLFKLFRQVQKLSISTLLQYCNVKLKYWLIAAGVAAVLGPVLTFIAVLVAKKVIKARLKLISHNIYSLMAPVLDGQSTKDLLNEFCTPATAWGTPATCGPSASQTSYRNEMLTFNGGNGPSLSKQYAISQGNWQQIKCLWPDQWKETACSGPSGYYAVDGIQASGQYGWSQQYKSAHHASPNKVGQVNAGDNFLYMDLPSQCTNDHYFALAAKDVQAGSVSTIVAEYLGDISVEGLLSFRLDVVSTFAPIASTLDMNTASASTPFRDVNWAPYTDKHERLHILNYFFLDKVVYEFTTGDKDGYLTCSTKPGWVFPGGASGKLQGCDQNDTNASVGGSRMANWSCTPQTSCAGLSGRQPDGCGGYYDCPLTNLCGNGTCDYTYGETASTCINDCGYCGDHQCTAARGETVTTCPMDCDPYYTYCGDGSCNGSESSYTCSTDCGSPPAVCGNYICESGESGWCTSDCGGGGGGGGGGCGPGQFCEEVAW